MILFRLLCGLVPFVAFASASSGDRSPPFQQCLSNCVSRACTEANGTNGSPNLPLILRLTRWTCTDDCKYQCMHILTDIALHEQVRAQNQGLYSHSGTRVHQYYGKWPFWRFAGMQEPASVVFSLLNMAVHIAGMKKIAKEIPKHFHMRTLYLVWSGLAVNAWVWSSVFHTRDTPATEILDYFSAGLVILYSLFFTVVRLFHLRPVAATSRPSITYKLWAMSCGLMYLGHISYLTLLPRFDYTYNMAANLIVGLIHNALWLLYPWSSIRLFPGRDKHYRPSFSLQPALFVLLTTLATSLELFDFPPWYRTVDAHALWHLATVPIAPLWYDFLVKDALDQGWRPLKM
ncbi:PER1 protein [Rhizoctonia solani AG-1 IA]|uniref:Post-GPI attachment to proteins factor 3 n=1 Tax=Thanatephorus cucumeris (strain AG1-IA) TaxID=983506 RepID=L8WZN5_THACA|nr:PER1 protein [Rhizoctonia solani AG-1 IA]